MNQAVLLDGVSKAFPGTRALDRVSLAIERGEIHALLGGNGSGKTTLIKAMAGVQPADEGTFSFNGNTFQARELTPALARAQRLHFVHQQPSTFGTMTVLENLAIGSGFVLGVGGRIRWREERRRAAEVLRRFHINAEPGQELASLGPATQTMVAIARALQHQEHADSAVLVLDEPTASLSAPEVKTLLGALRRYATAGQTILYVTHRLDEVSELADRASVLRDGRLVGTLERGELTPDRLAELIVGVALDNQTQQRDSVPGGLPVLSADRLAGGAVSEATLELHGGSITGLAGLVGSGRSTLLRMLFGAFSTTSGTIRLDGQPVELRSPTDAIARGIAYVPEDRRAAGFFDLSVSANIAAADVARYWRGGRLHHRDERKDTARLMDSFLIKAASPDAPLASLSGGNQQKVLLARWLRHQPRVLLLDEPTQGVDVGARLEIHSLLRKAAANGTAVLVASSDFEELCEVCDRIFVLRGGHTITQLAARETGAHQLNHLAYKPGD